MSKLHSETSGHNWREIAASAYRAYGASTGNKNYQGKAMPKFEDLTEGIQIAWQCAVRHAVNVFGSADSVRDEDITRAEKAWNGWKP